MKSGTKVYQDADQHNIEPLSVGTKHGPMHQVGIDCHRFGIKGKS
jgi:hypothetical protein